MQYYTICFCTGASDCSQLFDYLQPIKNKWKEFSERLGLPQKSIQSIALTSLLDDDCLKSALLTWLNGEYNQSVYGPPTLGRVCAAHLSSQLIQKGEMTGVLQWKKWQVFTFLLTIIL